MRTVPLGPKARVYKGWYFCDNCSKEFKADEQTPVRYESEDGTLGTPIMELWMFCSKRCREEFKERE